ncbi:unnamed protein product [Plutella xylostella]|uniref:(diamondback moth) hypothetical protein n=1 Tax=Plutella xylostella TaxID=51655 RepID=A0A8S4DP97_PLUXY|nr:unnamed protein product [Plutella xylostella]
MGNENSIPMGELCSNFDADEIRRLGKRFRKLDLDNSGALSIDEFMSLPELQQNPLVQRVIDIFDADGNGESKFHNSRVRAWRAVRELDLDNSGALSIDEFMSLPELQQNPLVQRVIDIFDADGNGEVSAGCWAVCGSGFIVGGVECIELIFVLN